MELSQLRAFVAVYDQGGFGAGARYMGVSQSALSHQIARLETSLDLMLFDRSGRKATLTDSGEALLPRARSLLRDARLIESEVASETGSNAVELRLGAIPTVSSDLVPSVLSTLVSENPSVRVSYVEAPTHELVTMLERGEIHAALMARAAGMGHLHMHEIGTERLVVAAKRGDPVMSRGALDVEDIRRRGIISLDEVHCLGEQTKNWCLERGIVGSVRCRATQLSTVMRLVEQGVGISMVPEMCVATMGNERVEYRETHAEGLSRLIVLASVSGSSLPGVVSGVVRIARSEMSRVLGIAGPMIGARGETPELEASSVSDA